MFGLNEDKKVVISNVIFLGILQGVNSLLPLITLPYLLNVVGASYFGLIVFSAAIMTYFSLIVDYGFNLTATNQVSKYRNDIQKINKIFNAIMTIKFLIVILCFFVLVLIINCIETFSEHRSIYMLSFGSVIGQAILPMWLFQGLERMRYIVILNIIAKIFFTIFIFIFVNHKEDYWMVPLFNSMGFLISGFISIKIIHEKFNIRLALCSFYEFKKQLYEGFHVFLSTISVSLYSNSIIIILGIFCGFTSAGYFSIADKIIQGVKGLYQPISQAIYPYLAKKFNQDNDDILLIVRRLIIYFASPMLIFCLCLFIFADFIVHKFFGDNLNQTVFMLRVMSFLPFLGVLSNILGVQTILNLGYRIQFTRILISAAIFGLLGSFIFVPRFGGVGASFVLLLVEVFVTLSMGIFIFKKTNLIKNSE